MPPEPASLACADEFIERMPDKYDTHIEQGGTNVSGGQKTAIYVLPEHLLKNPKDFDSWMTQQVLLIQLQMQKSEKLLGNEIPDTTKIIIAQRISVSSGCRQNHCYGRWKN